jgi:hypothetical protein
LVDAVILECKRYGYARHRPWWAMRLRLNRSLLYVATVAAVTPILIAAELYLAALHDVPSLLVESIFDRDELVTAAIQCVSLTAVICIPLTLEMFRRRSQATDEVSRLSQLLLDRTFYTDILAVSWEVTTKWLHWTGDKGDGYRFDVAGGTILFRHRDFGSEAECRHVPFQNVIRFHGHFEPKHCFTIDPEATAHSGANEHMALTIWINYWKEVERSIAQDRITEAQAYERLSHFFGWFSNFHQQLWMVEVILRKIRPASINSLENLRELASLEARFRRQAKRAGSRTRFEIEPHNWSRAEVVARTLAEHDANAQTLATGSIGDTHKPLRSSTNEHKPSAAPGPTLEPQPDNA